MWVVVMAVVVVNCGGVCCDVWLGVRVSVLLLTRVV